MAKRNNALRRLLEQRAPSEEERRPPPILPPKATPPGGDNGHGPQPHQDEPKRLTIGPLPPKPDAPTYTADAETRLPAPIPGGAYEGANVPRTPVRNTSLLQALGNYGEIARQGANQAGFFLSSKQREEAARMRKEGTPFLDAMTFSAREGDLPWGVRGGLEMLTDPVELLPGGIVAGAARTGARSAVKAGTKAAQTVGRNVGEAVAQAGGPRALLAEELGAAGRGVPKARAGAVTGGKQPWQMTRSEAVGAAPVVPDPPRPLSKAYGKVGPTPEQAAEYRRNVSARQKALREYKAHVERSNEHLAAVTRAVEEGQPVPAGVLQDYPWLARTTAPAPSPARPAAAPKGVTSPLRPPARVYHGSQQVFETFDPGKGNMDALYGPGAYFTEDPSVASGYAKTRRVREGQPNVTPARLNIERPFDIDAPADPKILAGLRRLDDAGNSFVGEALDVVGADSVDGIKTNHDLYQVLNALYGNKAEVNDAIAAWGFDSITHIGGRRTGTPPHRVWIVLPDDNFDFGARIQPGLADAPRTTTPTPEVPRAAAAVPEPAAPAARVARPRGRPAAARATPPEAPAGAGAPEPAAVAPPAPPREPPAPPVATAAPPPPEDPIEAAVRARRAQRAAAVAEPSAAPPETPVSKLTSLIREAKPAREETQQLYTERRRQQAAQLRQIYSQNRGEEAFNRALASLRGELPRADFEAPKDLMTPEDVTALFDMIRTSPALQTFDRVNTGEAFRKLITQGRIPTRSELANLEKVFGKDLIDAILSKRRLGDKVWEEFLGVIGLPRAILSSFDLSAPFRQGALLVGQPKEFAGAFVDMFRALRSDAGQDVVDAAIKANPNYGLAEDSGLYIAPLGRAATLSQREEAFMSRLAEKIPGIRASQRAYVGFLNSLRARTFYNYAEMWKDDPRVTRKDFQNLANFINNASGRGNLKFGKVNLEESSAALAQVFFSPRYLASRFQAPLSLAADNPFKAGPSVSRIAARNLTAFMAMNIGLLSLLANAAGASVNLDPRSADFGKAKIGNTRLDFFAGYSQIARLVAMMQTAQGVTGATGRAYEANRGGTLGRFIRTKLAPLPAFITDLLLGTTVSGDELTFDGAGIKDQVWERFVPMSIQDMWEAVEEHGLPGAAFAPVPVFGGSMATYESFASQVDVTETRRDEAQRIFGKPLNQLNARQRRFLDQQPSVTAMQGRTDPERTATPASSGAPRGNAALRGLLAR